MEKLSSAIFNKWKEEIEVIVEEVKMLLQNKQIHDGFTEIYNSNVEHIQKNEGGNFCKFVRYCYGVQATVGIRRLVKKQDKVSLGKILDQISKYENQLDYNFYISMHEQPSEHEWQKNIFKTLSEDGLTLSSKIIEKDLKELDKVSDKVIDLVDNRLAHLDNDRNSRKILYKDISDSLEIIEKLAVKYYTFLCGNEYGFLNIPIQNKWQNIFNVAWNITKTKR